MQDYITEDRTKERAFREKLPYVLLPKMAPNRIPELLRSYA